MYKMIAAPGVPKSFGFDESSDNSHQQVPVGQRSMSPPAQPESTGWKVFSLFGEWDNDDESERCPTSSYQKAQFTSPERNTSPIEITPSRINKLRGGTIQGIHYVYNDSIMELNLGSLLGDGMEGLVHNASISDFTGSHELAIKSPKKGFSLQTERRLADKLESFASPGKKHLSLPINSRSTSGDFLLEKANGDLFDILIGSGKLKDFLQGTAEDSLKKGFILHIMLQLLDGIKAFHIGTEHIHCDIKLENILHAGSRRLLIHDFGSAKSADGNSANGTPAYASPESKGAAISALEITDELSPKSDVFSLGAVFCKLITGKEYFKLPAETCVTASTNDPLIEQQIVRYLKTIHPKVLRKEIPLSDPVCAPLQGLLEDVVFKMLEVQPRNRYTINTARDLVLPQWQELKAFDPLLENKIKELWEGWKA